VDNPDLLFPHHLDGLMPVKQIQILIDGAAKRVFQRNHAIGGPALQYRLEHIGEGLARKDIGGLAKRPADGELAVRSTLSLEGNNQLIGCN